MHYSHNLALNHTPQMEEKCRKASKKIK